MSSETKSKIIKFIIIVVSLYLFLLSIKLMGFSFKLFGKEFAVKMIEMTSNPFAGLIIGIVATSLIQSSSTTTSIVVGLVAGGALTLRTAIPIVMGANIGTTITNTLVSMGHVTNRMEFKRAFSAGIVHDFFNICSVIVIFPLEIQFHFIERMARGLETVFADAGGMKVFNPLKLLLDPAIHQIDSLFTHVPHKSIFMLLVSVVVMFLALVYLVKSIRSLVLVKVELVINNYLFRNDLTAFLLGILLTAIVQSSSVTTSLIIPLAGAGLISLRQIFPYTLGANIGTTVTAILAALATEHDIAVTVAFSHLCFNVMGIFVFYPMKFIPIRLAHYVGKKASLSTRNLLIFLAVYLMVYFLPIFFIFIL